MSTKRSEETRQRADRHPPRAIPLEQRLAAIRGEVQQRRKAHSRKGLADTEGRWGLRLPRVTGLTAPAPRDVPRLRDLLIHDDESFVASAYRVILGRDPDGPGWTHNLVALRCGQRSKVEIAGRLRYSAEGRRRGIRIRGLAVAFALEMFAQVPVLGRLVAWPTAIGRIVGKLRAMEFAEARLHRRITELAHLVDRAFEQLERTVSSTPDLVNREFESLIKETQVEGRLEELEAEVVRLRGDSSEPLDLARVSERLHAAIERLELLERRIDDDSAFEAIVARVQGMADELDHVRSQSAVVERVPEILEQLERIRAEMALQESIDVLEASMALLTGDGTEPGRLAALETNLRAEFQANEVERVREGGALREQLGSLDSAVASLVGGTEGPGRIAQLEAALRSEMDQSLLQSAAGVQAVSQQQGAMVDSLGERIAVLSEEFLAQQVRLRDSDRRVRRLLADARQDRGAVDLAVTDAARSEENSHLWDSLYSDLEDRFRGDCDDIRDRLRAYLSHSRSAIERTGDETCLDLGCGRGEWLELVREEGWIGSGVDRNRRMVERSSGLGLDVHAEDLVDYLRLRKDSSVSVMTGFHILEHLSFEDLLSVVDDAHRTLKSGGVAIFESPNPENLLVGACNFYADPTHRNPIFPATLAFILEHCGFSEVRVLYPSPVEVPEWMEPVVGEDALATRLNPLLDGVQSWFAVSPDFAVVGTKL